MSKTKVYVGGLVDDVGNDRLHRTFEKFGKIKKVWVARNPGSRGYAFIDFYEPEHALTASEEMNGKHVFGTNLKVELSTNGIDYTKFSEKYRNYDDRRGGRDHDSRREDRERERRRSERDRDYRRRSPPYHSRRRSIQEDDEDDKLTDVGHIRSSDLPRTINIIRELERVTRLRIERELLDKIRNSSALLSDIESKDFISRSLNDGDRNPPSPRNRDTVHDDLFVTSLDPIFQDHHNQTLDDDKPNRFDSKPGQFYSHYIDSPRGPPRCLLPTPNFPRPRHQSFHGAPSIPPWNFPPDHTRAPFRSRYNPYGNRGSPSVNGNLKKNDWYGKKYYGFGFLPTSAHSSTPTTPTTHDSPPSETPQQAEPCQTADSS